jgi:hypothetical protein
VVDAAVVVDGTEPDPRIEGDHEGVRDHRVVGLDVVRIARMWRPTSGAGSRDLGVVVALDRETTAMRGRTLASTAKE